jgi:hypothetical protein
MFAEAVLTAQCVSNPYKVLHHLGPSDSLSHTVFIELYPCVIVTRRNAVHHRTALLLTGRKLWPTSHPPPPAAVASPTSPRPSRPASLPPQQLSCLQQQSPAVTPWIIQGSQPAGLHLRCPTTRSSWTVKFSCTTFDCGPCCIHFLSDYHNRFQSFHVITPLAA